MLEGPTPPSVLRPTMTVPLRSLHDLKQPLHALEAAAIRRQLARPEEVHQPLLDGLRYVLSFARLGVIRNEDGLDVEVAGFLARHREHVTATLTPHLTGRDETLWGAIRELPALVAATRARRSELLEHFEVDRDSLEAEVTTRQLVIASGGGGGGGYGYAGAFRTLHRAGLQPELLSGTSIGALMSMFRARLLPFDGAPLVAAARRLSWSSVFRVLDIDSRYGIPASLRLYLRSALGSHLGGPVGRSVVAHDHDRHPVGDRVQNRGQGLFLVQRRHEDGHARQVTHHGRGRR